MVYDALQGRSVNEITMGKSCIRLTNATHIPYELLGELVEKMTPDAWIKVYEQR